MKLKTLICLFVETLPLETLIAANSKLGIVLAPFILSYVSHIIFLKYVIGHFVQFQRFMSIGQSWS